MHVFYSLPPLHWILLTSLFVCSLGAIYCLLPTSVLRLLGWRKRSHRRRERTARRVIAKLAEIDGVPARLAYLRQIDPYVFEELVLEALERRGHKVKRTTRYSGDGGIDGRFWVGKQLYLVQAKRYRGHVSAKHVGDFCKVVQRHGCKGVFVHTGRTGKASLAHINSSAAVSLVSGERLIRLLAPPQLA